MGPLVWSVNGSDGEQRALARERTRLVRLCARLTGDADAAEDLAQETLLEAWRSSHKLRDPAGRDRWLSAIARNVCLRWLRDAARARSRSAGTGESVDPADDFDLEAVLEARELAGLLGRALALLPAESRQILVERYVHGAPYAEIAGRMGLSEDAVSMRLTRGKRLLRRLLATELRQEALACGLYDASADGWRETRVWCPECGQRRLLARFPAPPGTVSFRCPACNPDPRVNAADYRLADAYFARLLDGLTRPRLVLRRTYAWSHGYFRRALRDGSAECTNCGRPLHLHMSMPETASPDVRGRPGVHVRCEACGAGCSSSLNGLVFSLPEAQRFWRAHARIRALPAREIEADGRVAIISRFQSLSASARLDVISARDTFAVLGIHVGAESGGS